MIDSPDFVQELGDILDTAIAVQQADFGNVQVFDEATQTLRIVAQRGFNAEFLEHFREVRGDSSVCGRAARGMRVVVQDVEQDPGFAPHLEIARSAGFRAVQSTPITRTEGQLLGILSTHFRQPCTPSTTSLVETDVCAFMAAKVIEARSSVTMQPSDNGDGALDASKRLQDSLLSLMQSKRHTIDLRRRGSLTGFSPEFSALVQRATVTFAVAKRAGGAMPEAMIVDLKRVLRQVDEVVPAELRSQLAADVVRWSIGAYYSSGTTAE